MCGIVGIVQQQETKIGKSIIESLTKLEYRGYDSVGIASIFDNKVLITKDQGKISEVTERIDINKIKGKIAIGHTRWQLMVLQLKKMRIHTLIVVEKYL